MPVRLCGDIVESLPHYSPITFDFLRLLRTDTLYIAREYEFRSVIFAMKSTLMSAVCNMVNMVVYWILL